MFFVITHKHVKMKKQPAQYSVSNTASRSLMRIFPFWVFLVAVVIFTSCTAPYNDNLLYVGTYTNHGSKGIYACHFDTLSGNLQLRGLAATIDNPSFLTIDKNGRFLYCVNESENFKKKKTGAVSVFSLNKKTGGLELMQQTGSMGAGPCHLSLDESGKYLLVANYGGGNFAVFPVLEDGRLGENTAFVQNEGSGPNADRQEKPHAHFICTTHNNRYVMVCDLGTDEVLVYRFDATNGRLTPADSAFMRQEPGSGPRHLAVSPCGKYVFVLNELTSAISVFGFDAKNGKSRHEQSVSSLPASFSGDNTGAEITTDAKGKFLYVSNRGHNSIGIFAIHPENGTLAPVDWISCGGDSPRHFTIDPTGKWLICANQKSGNIVVFSINNETGMLTQTNHSLSLNSPVCIKFLK